MSISLLSSCIYDKEIPFITSFRGLGGEVQDGEMLRYKIEQLYDRFTKVKVHKNLTKSDFISREAFEFAFKERELGVLDFLQGILKCKKKKNVGDYFKAHVVDDDWATELVMTINLRSLKNFIKLRDSASAWEPMRELAQAMIEALPKEYRALVKKGE